MIWICTLLSNRNGSPVDGEWEILRGEEKETVTMVPTCKTQREETLAQRKCEVLLFFSTRGKRVCL